MLIGTISSPLPLNMTSSSLKELAELSIIILATVQETIKEDKGSLKSLERFLKEDSQLTLSSKLNLNHLLKRKPWVIGQALTHTFLSSNRLSCQRMMLILLLVVTAFATIASK